MKATVLSLPHIPKKTLGVCAENAHKKARPKSGSELLSTHAIVSVVVRVYLADGADIHQLCVFTVGVDGAEQGAAGISDRCGITLAGCSGTLTTCREQHYQ